MEMIERYVRAVGERLHPSRREEVEAELRGAVLDALEARGAAPESEDDVAAVLAELGDPERVAAEYQPNRRYLIGPELYPLFRRALRVALTALVLASAAGYGITLLLGGLADFRAGAILVNTLAYAVTAALVASVVLVGVFAWLQRAEVRLPRRLRSAEGAWDPRSLPARRPADRAPRSESVAGLAVAAVVLVALGGIGSVATDVLPHAAAGLRPLIREAVIANVLLLQAGLVLSALAHAAALLQGRWQLPTRGLRLVADLVAVFVFVRLPLQLLEHRPALLGAGVSRNFASWLVANAVVIAAIVVAVTAFYWWRASRRTDGRAPRPSALSVAAPSPR